ncbi:MAG TPA: NADH-quinone oxidoreductase subunit N [Frankiaceae bacterium]|nr:NADH-quinone oxidoreductase subunit N [Frankiaceae bacterium]
MSALQSVDFHAVAPVLALGGGALAVLVADLFLPPARRWLAMPLALAATLTALVAAVTLVPGRPHPTFCTPATTLPAAVGGARVPASCSYVVDGFALLFQVVVLATLAIVLLLGLSGAREARLPAGEYHLMLLCSATGMVTIAASRDLLTLFISLELLSVPAFVLAGLRRHDARSSEAALTFFLVGVVSSAVTLFGIGLTYGLTGSLHFDRIALQLARPDVRGAPAAAAVVLTLVGFAFKVSAVPFHTWAPDTYTGAPIPVATFLSVASKASGFAGLLAVLLGAFRPYADVWGPVVAVLAVATMVVGNVVALQQRHAVRLLAWSSVAQSGYMLVPLGVAASARGRAESLDTALSATLAYVAIYAAMNLGAFACVAAVARRSPRNLIEDYRGLARASPLLAVALGFFLLCLAGAPPGLAGLFAKLVVFRATIDGGVAWLGVVMALATVVGLAYYVRFTALLFAGPDERADARTAGVAPARAEVPGTLRAAIGVAAAAALVIGVVPQLVLHVAPLSTLAAR